MVNLFMKLEYEKKQINKQTNKQNKNTTEKIFHINFF